MHTPLGTLAAFLLSAACAAGQIPLPLWSWWDDGATSAPFVSIGDHGGQVFAHLPAPCCSEVTGALLFGDAGPLLWAVNTRRDVSWGVDSADADDVHVSIVTRENVPAGPYDVLVHRWSSSSKKPTWTQGLGVWTPPASSFWAFGRPRIGISRDGVRVVAMVEVPGTGGRHDLFVLDGATGAVRSRIEVPAPDPRWPDPPTLTSFDLSADGSVAAWRLGRGGYVFDLVGGQVLLSLDDGGAEYTGGHIAVSGDGNVVALSDSIPGSVRLYERAAPGDDYGLVLVHEGFPEAWGGVLLDVSGNGSTVAVAYGGFDFPGNHIWVQALDVPSRTLTMTGSLSNFFDSGYRAEDLAISDDGQRFVVGVYGGQDYDGERLFVFVPDQDEPLWSDIELLGGVRDVDISPDGRCVAFGASYLDEPGASVWLLPVEGSADFVVTGAPELGGVVHFAVAGAPGSLAWLALSAAPAVPPLVLGGGVLYLEPASLVLLPIGVVAGDGTAHLSASVPPDPQLLGVESWTQGLLVPGDVLSESWRKLTVVP